MTESEERQHETAARATRAVVDLQAIGHNIAGIRQRIGERRHLMAVVKADGYGHGAVQVSRTALKNGADCLAVAVPEEGLELRNAAIDCPILVFGLIQPSEAWKPVEAGLEQTVCSVELLEALDQESRNRGVVTPVHVKVDTGMGRIGLAPADVVEFARKVAACANLHLKGLYSHFSCADEKDKSFTHTQMARFQEVRGALAAAGIDIPVKHIANSAGVLDFPEAHFDLVRPGIMIYGLYPSQDVSHSVELRPAMSFVTRVCHVKRVPAGTPIGYGATFVTSRESVIATMPVGYADGYRRLLTNKGEVLVRGTRVPLVGRVAMDMCMLDVTEVPGTQVGDEIVLFGKGLPVEEMASLIGTINYEVVTLIGKRVPRVYV
ncbi:MAG: alanine racemase [Dehalococcoidia bacterium]|nr:alanine racemase [Dehalococcoidia bacterium]